MRTIHIDEILLRRGESGLTRVFSPSPAAHGGLSLGRPFCIIETKIPKSPQIDDIVNRIEQELKDVYGRGTLRPGQTNEQFFEEAVGRIRRIVMERARDLRIKIDPGMTSIVLGCVSGNDIYLTRHGDAQAYLIRRAPDQPTKTADIFRGLDETSEDQILNELVVGNITDDDMVIIATGGLFRIMPIADLIKATDHTDPAAVTARIRNLILSAGASDSVAGCLVRLAPVPALLAKGDNTSLKELRSREEEVARTLSPSGLPGLRSLVSAFKPAAKQPSLQTKRSLVERFNAMPRMSRRALVIIFALLAVFAVSLKIIAYQNSRQAADTAVQKAAADVRRTLDAADATMIYNEGRGRELVAEARALFDKLPDKTKAEKAARAELGVLLAAADRRLEHRYDAVLSVITALDGPASILIVNDNDLIANAGANLMTIDPVGKTSSIATLPDSPVWSVPTVDDRGKIAAVLFWLKNDTLISFDPTGAALPRALDYQGPTAPRDSAVWNGNLYVLAGDGKNIVKLPPTLTGYGRGANWLAEDLSNGASSITIDGKIYASIAGDAVRLFEKGKMLPFAAVGASALTDPGQIEITASKIYLLGNDNTVAIFNKDAGGLVAQYSVPDTSGKVTAFGVNESAGKIYVATDKGTIASFEMAK